MNAAIVAVGSELLGGDRVETNSLKLALALEPFGVVLKQKTVVGDLEDEIAAELERLLKQVDLVLVTGGLGPTADDVTREAVAQVFGRGLEVDSDVLASIEERFSRLGVPMPEVNRRQADLVEGAEVIPNPRGTAPGMFLQAEGASLFLFPGVPSELEGMIEKNLKPWLRGRTAGDALERSVVKVACLAESRVEELIAPVYAEFGRTSITVLAQPGEIHLHLKASGQPEARRERLSAMARRVEDLLGDVVFALSEAKTLEAVVGELLVRAESTVTVAESCTGGLLAERFTRVAGSSGYFLGGVVVYSNELKTQLLGIAPEEVDSFGAVSEPVARRMALGVRERLRSTYGLAVTGIAGPGGGTGEKPVGTVHLAVAGPEETDLVQRKVRFSGGRDRVRRLSSQLALDLLRRQLLARGRD